VYREDISCTLKWKEAKKIIHILPLVTKDRLEYPTIMLVLKIETDTGKGNSESRGVGLFAA